MTVWLLVLACVVGVVAVLGAPLHDCGTAPIPLCVLAPHALEALLVNTSLPHSPPLTALIHALRDEEVTGEVWLSLEAAEILALVDDSDVVVVDQMIALRQSLYDAHTAADIDTNDCKTALNTLASGTRAALAAVAELATSTAADARPAPRPYTGQYPSSAASRRLPLLLRDQPRVIFLWGVDSDSDVSFVLYSAVPDAIVVEFTTRRGDTMKMIADKVDRRRVALATSGKRGPSHNFAVQLSTDSELHSAVCLAMAAGIQPDLVWMAASLHPLPLSPSMCECEWWNSGAIIGGNAPAVQHLHSLALLTSRRVYSDSPLFLLSQPSLVGAHCDDDMGHTLSSRLIDAPLLGLYMIVKNELGGIEKTMASVLPVVDSVTVLDTGSTDGTDSMIEELLAEYGVSGTVHRGEFVDFSTTRNRALSLAATDADTVFTLMLNGDDDLVDGQNIRTFLEPRRFLCGPSDEMYLLSVDYDGKKLAWSERLMRTSNHRHPHWPHKDDTQTVYSANRWHYEGLTHESYTHPLYASGSAGDFAMVYAGHPTAGTTTGDGLSFHIHHTYVRDTPDKLRLRAKKDVELLKRQLEMIGDDPRTVYYISHSYDVLEDYDNAYQWHQRRTADIVAKHQSQSRSSTPSLAADNEECTCLLRLGKIAAFRLPEQYGWSVAEPWFALAQSLCPEQIETRFYLAQHYYEQGSLKKAYQIAQEAERLLQSGKGLMHVLENDTVRQRTPQLLQLLKQALSQKKSKKSTKTEL